MAKYHLPNGAHIFVEATAGAEITATAISNASAAALTVAADSLADGDIVRIVNSGWNELSGLVVRVNVADDVVTLDGIDTSDTDIYPAGGAAGTTLVKILTWAEVPNITTVSPSGNEQQFYTFQFLADQTQRNMPTYKSAETITLTFAHDSTLDLYPLLRTADRKKKTMAVYFALPGVETRYWSATGSFNDRPTVTINELEAVTLALATQSQMMTFVPSE